MSFLSEAISQIGRRLADTCPHDIHCHSTHRAGDFGPLLLLPEHGKWWPPQNQLEKLDEFFTTGREKTVAYRFLKTLLQNVEHQQVEVLFPGDSPRMILFAFGAHVTECDHAVFATRDILLLNDALI
jgi:hypothetical protein